MNFLITIAHGHFFKRLSSDQQFQTRFGIYLEINVFEKASNDDKMTVL